jgi:hypothetical protein
MRSVCLLLALVGCVIGCGGKTCREMQESYDKLLSSARECALGAANQCGIEVPAGFVCGCTTRVNGRADELAVIMAQYKGAGCQGICNGICIQPRAFSCQADSTSSTGGRCVPQDLLDLTGDDDGRSFSVTAGSEIDIVLQDIGADQYATQALLSSDAATVLEVTIPAGAPNPAGLRHLYRIGAVSAGRVVVQIPRASTTSDAAMAAFMVTLDIH